ncbi:MAG TPA: DinB family protein [Candidatus Lokiarchaeia archaeon]|nr:DinB family protein [Candidatus Lokiarchaeia archaeon]
MKELIQLYADYNIQTNRALIEILETLSPEQLTQDVGAYYRSILGIFNHMLMTDASWMTRIASFFPELADIVSAMPDTQWQEFSAKWRESGGKFPEEMPFETLEALKPVRFEMDNLMKAMVETLTEEQFATRLTWTSWRGDEVSKLAWHVVMHVFNHQTHHRGGLAVMLDILGVDNDYSNLIAIEY